MRIINGYDLTWLEIEGKLLHLLAFLWGIQINWMKHFEVISR
jgi:hypothetical protein